MKLNNSTWWSIGCSKVAWLISTQCHHTVQNVFYVLTFGQKPCIGISYLPLNLQIIDTLHTEEHVYEILNNKMVCQSCRGQVLDPPLTNFSNTAKINVSSMLVTANALMDYITMSCQSLFYNGFSHSLMDHITMSCQIILDCIKRQQK